MYADSDESSSWVTYLQHPAEKPISPLHTKTWQPNPRASDTPSSPWHSLESPYGTS